MPLGKAATTKAGGANQVLSFDLGAYTQEMINL